MGQSLSIFNELKMKFPNMLPLGFREMKFQSVCLQLRFLAITPGLEEEQNIKNVRNHVVDRVLKNDGFRRRAIL